MADKYVDSIHPGSLEALGHDPYQPVMKYVDHLDFPATAPIDHLHLLKEEEFAYKFNCEATRLCDVVVTLLYHLDGKKPGALKDFFDMNIKRFVFL
jgi:hypothetical protein